MRDELLWLTAYAGCTATLIVFLAGGGAVPLGRATQWLIGEAESASVFFVQSTTSVQIQQDYTGGPYARNANDSIKVLIVPGHQPGAGGTEFGAVKERDIVVDIADSLAALLEWNPHYQVTVARGKESWNPILQTYFDTHTAEIEKFIEEQKLLMQTYLAQGNIRLQTEKVYHNSASAQAAIQLYGINKWANENDYDITLHLHINDDAERSRRAAGQYDGFAVYVPNHQYSNAEASRAIGTAIAARLAAYHATSTLDKENAGVVEDQQLIAVGSNNTADNAAILIEYGYIYEPQFRDGAVLPLAVADYAYATYLGLQDFFKDPVQATYGTTVLPLSGTQPIGTYQLQAALRHLGYYPPSGKSLTECPVSGVAGACTRAAVKAYQEAQGLEQTGELGPLTRAELLRETLR